MKAATYSCANCGRRLTRGRDGKPRWVFSRHTNNRYCMPGKGCQK